MLALGGSTNAIVHMIALARHAGVSLDLARFDALARNTPVLANIRPSGKYLMEDFYYAGGLRAMLAQLTDLLDTSVITANGRTLGENIADATVYYDDVIRPRSNPLVASDLYDGEDGLYVGVRRFRRNPTIRRPSAGWDPVPPPTDFFDN